MKQRSVRDSARVRRSTGEAAAVADTAAEEAVPAAEEVEDAEEADGGEVVWELGGTPRKATPARQPQVPLKERLRRIPPGAAMLSLAAVLSLGFLLYEIASRTASVQILTSAGLVCGMVYVAVAIACAAATWRLGHEGRLWSALLVAFLGGCAAFVAAGAFAGALVLFLALGF